MNTENTCGCTHTVKHNINRNVDMVLLIIKKYIKSNKNL